MAVSPKIPSLHVVPRAVPDEISVQPIALVPKPLQLDFAANPNHYRVDGYGKKIKPQPVRCSRTNPTLRPVLSLSLLCDSVQEPDETE